MSRAEELYIEAAKGLAFGGDYVFDDLQLLQKMLEHLQGVRTPVVITALSS